MPTREYPHGPTCQCSVCKDTAYRPLTTEQEAQYWQSVKQRLEQSQPAFDAVMGLHEQLAALTRRLEAVEKAANALWKHSEGTTGGRRIVDGDDLRELWAVLQHKEQEHG